MNNNEKWEADIAQKNAARTLLQQYIAEHPQDIMFAIEELIPFFSECSYSGLQGAMNTVNVAIASVSLKVIEDIAEHGDEESPERSYLPVDAREMQSAVYYLTKFVRLLGPLSHLCGNDKVPAIVMTNRAFSKPLHI
jgi:hypothetical protein